VLSLFHSGIVLVPGDALTLVAWCVPNLVLDLDLPGRELFTDAWIIGITAVFPSVAPLKRREAGVKGHS